MKRHLALSLAILLASALLPQPLRASDHADPQELTNPFYVQPYPEANITDLHAFTTDASGRLITDRPANQPGDRLVLSLCVRRALRPDQIAGLKFKGYKFRIHLDTGAAVRLFDPARTRAGDDYAAARKKLDEEVKNNVADAVARRSALIAGYQEDKQMQALYGGIIEQPESIAPTVELEFELKLEKRQPGEQSQCYFTKVTLQGIAGPRKLTTEEGPVPLLPVDDTGKPLPNATQHFEPGMNYFQTGIYDDPFIFPRFFRRNVVAMVASIPLENLPPAKGPILIWATSHVDGKQFDHVGRSLRTQLPRFGYLNDKAPSEHVAAIHGAAEKPDVKQDMLATLITPLVAHRHYDFVPDVMVYDLNKPAHFPNGRVLEDDVAQILTDAGEPLLLELAYTESNDFPRANKNDKEFSRFFPYLAPRWTAKEVAANVPAGTTMPKTKPPHSAATEANWMKALPENLDGLFGVPRRGEPTAIAFKSFEESTWNTFWLLEVLALVVLTLSLLLTLRSGIVRTAIVIIFLITLCRLQLVRAENIKEPTPEMMQQPGQKVCRLIFGGGVIAVFGVWWLVALGRRWGAKYAHPESEYPPLRQELTTGEAISPYLHGESTYEEIADALFGDGEKSGRYYKEWGEPNQKPLPIYRATVALLAGGLFRAGKDFAMLSAARRTLKSRADLRWGPDKKGWHRIVHTMGVCLEGTWTIDDEPQDNKTYTGYFAKGRTGRVIGRYSLGGNEVRNGHKRSLALVGKLFPPKEKDVPGKPTPRAHFITQEDLGGAYTDSVTDAQLFNSPPVTLFNRGSGIFSFLVVISALMQADKEPSERQLYEIAELEKPDDEKTRCPRFMRLTIDKGQNYPKVVGDEADFREEILSLMYKGSGTPRPLVFNIEVSDTGYRTPLQKLRGQEPWHRIGQITFNEAAASHNGDFVVHFHHPAWRTDRNDPSSIARSEHKS